MGPVNSCHNNRTSETVNETGISCADVIPDVIPDVIADVIANEIPDKVADEIINEKALQMDIEMLCRAKTYLDSLPLVSQSPDYKKIVDLVNSYIEKNCKHHIVDDNIDVGYEESRTIRYCELCLKTIN
jgi:hypothetical protein